MTAAKVTFLLSLASWLLSGTMLAQDDLQARLAKARATDPVTLGWMVGSPPPPDKLIRFEDGSFYRFPQWRWSW